MLHCDCRRALTQRPRQDQPSTDCLQLLIALTYHLRGMSFLQVSRCIIWKRKGMRRHCLGEHGGSLRDETSSRRDRQRPQFGLFISRQSAALCRISIVYVKLLAFPLSTAHSIPAPATTPPSTKFTSPSIFMLQHSSYHNQISTRNGYHQGRLCCRLYQCWCRHMRRLDSEYDQLDPIQT